MDDLVQRLRVLGLSLYEARIYLGLLRHGPQNGNELARSAGLPSSKVYATLEKLASLGIVHSVRQDGTTEYVCIPPDELVERFRRHFNEPLDDLERTLPSLAAFRPAAEILSVGGIDAIRESARSLVRAATRELYMSVWPEDLDAMGEPLEAAAARGVRIFGMLYGDAEAVAVGSWLQHSYRDIVGDRLGGRMLTLVADAEEALIAHIPRKGEASAVRTRNPVLCLIAQEYLHHDLVLQRAQLTIGFDQWDEWWQADPDLRTLILGESLSGAAEAAPSPRKRGARR